MERCLKDVYHTFEGIDEFNLSTDKELIQIVNLFQLIDGSNFVLDNIKKDGGRYFYPVRKMSFMEALL